MEENRDYGRWVLYLRFHLWSTGVDFFVALVAVIAVVTTVIIAALVADIIQDTLATADLSVSCVGFLTVVALVVPAVLRRLVPFVCH